MIRVSRKQKGFTLIELLIVVAIIGILAAIAIPNLLTAMQRSKQKRSMADIRSIATAWEARATDTNSYTAAGATFSMTGGTPARTAITYSAVAAMLAPTYIAAVPQNDGWGNAFNYTRSVATYAIRSNGKDGSATGATYTVGPTTDFDDDIVFSNGSFVTYPEGMQKLD